MNVSTPGSKIIVIGASAGGVEPIKEMVSKLPADFQTPIFIVWHVAPDTRGMLPEIINRLKTVPAVMATDKEPILPGHIYIAPPDMHLLIEKDHMRVTHGPKENRFRPAIDPLFRSAAYTYGSRVIGIILSGALDDGTAGLWTIKRRGGTTIVQEPADAIVASMPLNALQAVQVDYRVPVSSMADLLVELCNGNQSNANAKYDPDHIHQEEDNTLLEMKIAVEEPVDDEKIFALGERSKYTCPECHGVLTAIKDGNRVRFRCHTGHAFSAESLLSALEETIENNLWSAVRGIEESKFLLNYLGDHFSAVNKPKLGAAYFNRAVNADNKAAQVKRLIAPVERVEISEHDVE